jgi:hypothetical protein
VWLAGVRIGGSAWLILTQRLRAHSRTTGDQQQPLQGVAQHQLAAKLFCMAGVLPGAIMQCSFFRVYA